MKIPGSAHDELKFYNLWAWSISGVTFSCSDMCTPPFGLIEDDNEEVIPYISIYA